METLTIIATPWRAVHVDWLMCGVTDILSLRLFKLLIHTTFFSCVMLCEILVPKMLEVE